MRTLLTIIALFVGTFIFGTWVLLAQLLGVSRKPGGVYETAQRVWGKWLLAAAGVKVVHHGGNRLAEGAPRVFVSNHVSWFDIPVLLSALPAYGFVAKRELESVPFFGSAARAAGVIYIDRENRKAAFGAYADAAAKIREGQSVLVYPEGTRGQNYALRPFKKGPFVLAIGSGAPVIPVVVHGTIAVNPRGSLVAHSGVVHVHELEAIPTEGLSYDDRDALAAQTHARMSELLKREYGIEAYPARRSTSAEQIPPASAHGLSA